MSKPGNRRAATAYTTAVVLASAAAREDIEWLQRHRAGRFEFRLLAAAAQSTPLPPVEGWHDARRLLRINVAVVANELRVFVQAEGYAALQRVAGRGGRLVSANGVIDVQLTFDAAGHAVVVLADNAAVRNALESLSLTLDQSDEDDALRDDPSGESSE